MDSPLTDYACAVGGRGRLLELNYLLNRDVIGDNNNTPAFADMAASLRRLR